MLGLALGCAVLVTFQFLLLFIKNPIKRLCKGEFEQFSTKWIEWIFYGLLVYTCYIVIQTNKHAFLSKLNMQEVHLSRCHIWILRKRFSFILLLFVESASQWNWNMKFLKANFSSVNIQIISNAEQALFSWNITFI